jgi:hypothetical protein
LEYIMPSQKAEKQLKKRNDRNKAEEAAALG